MVDLIEKLDELHRKTEVNFEISTFWDGPIVFKIGDSSNGFEKQENFQDLENGIRWLITELEQYD